MRRGGGSIAAGPIATDETLSTEERRHVLRRTWRLLRPQRWWVVLACGLVVAQALAMLTGPAMVKRGIDRGVRVHNIHELNVAGLVFLLAALVAYVAGWGAIRTVTRVGESFLRDLRQRVFSHVMSLSMDFFDRSRTGVLVARMTADIEALQELVGQGLTMFLTNALLFVGAAIAMAAMSWELALGVLVVVPIVVRASVWFRRESNRAYLTLRDRIGATLSSLQEGLSGVRVVQAFRQEPVFVERFAQVNEQQFQANLHAERVGATYFPVIELAQGLAIAVILGWGGVLTHWGAITVGTVAAFVLYLPNMFEPIQQLSQLFNTLQASGAALHKLYGLLDETAGIAERPGAVDLPARGRIEVAGVSFAYTPGGEPVLRDVSIAVEPGERLALVGPTGAGKSTLAKLMARFYDPSEGTVRFGGVDLRDATLRSLRERIVVVPQEGFLFGGTIRDNVRIARPDASDGQMRRALEQLGLGWWLDALPDGLDTEVRERGTNFSAGERQLVSLVRAALADPAMLVLDEATSSLDPGTELVVEHALERLMEGRTVVVIAHRLSTAARADRVAVVQDGQVVQEGTHAALVAAEGPYAVLYASWTRTDPFLAREPGA